MSTRSAPSLQPLESDYAIIGELGARDARRAFLARRHADGRDVLVVVSRTPAGDEKHALTQLAADANLLAGLEHRNLLRVHEGHWLGHDEFALVIDRPATPTLRELLERGESLTNHRIAAILKEVNGLLEWAREQGVVHRVVTTDSLHLEPATDRVCAAFVIAPIPATGVPGPEGDARTIATLARAMLTGDPATTGTGDSLGERRPDLPVRIVEESDAFLRASRSADPLPDVRDYIARIAMVDALREGEDEIARVRTALYAERREFEQRVDDETRRLEEREAELERTYAERAEELERTLEQRRVELEGALTEQREALERDREELLRAVAADRASLVAQRQAFERAMVEERDRLAEERRALEQYRADTERLRLAPLLVPEAPQPADGVESTAESRGPIAEARAPTVGSEAPTSDDRDEPRLAGVWARVADPPRDFPRWTIPAAAVVLVGFVAVAAATMGDRPDREVPPTPVSVSAAPTARSSDGATPPTGVVVDSVAGRIADTAEKAPERKPTPRPRPAMTETTSLSRDTTSVRDTVVPSRSDTRVARDAPARATPADSSPFVGPPVEIPIPLRVITPRVRPPRDTAIRLRDSARERPIAPLPAPITPPRRDGTRPDSGRVPERHS